MKPKLSSESRHYQASEPKRCGRCAASIPNGSPNPPRKWLSNWHSGSSTARNSSFASWLTNSSCTTRKRCSSLDAKKLERLGKGIDNWAAVDTFACYLAGPAWRERQVADKLIHGWARSPDRWWRRAALVSTVALNNKARGGSGDAQRTLKVCEMLVNDRDDMVVKAMSWALRELAKRDQAAVRDFLRDHEKFLAPRVIREVNNKLRTGLKNPQVRN